MVKGWEVTGPNPSKWNKYITSLLIMLTNEKDITVIEHVLDLMYKIIF